MSEYGSKTHHKSWRFTIYFSLALILVSPLFGIFASPSANVSNGQSALPAISTATIKTAHINRTATLQATSALLSTSGEKYKPTCLSDTSLKPSIFQHLKIALVKPVFTSTPYSQYAFGSFYAFYHHSGNLNGNITSNLNWLNTSVSSSLKFNNGWGVTYSLYRFFNSQGAKNCGLVLGSNVFILSDINLTEGALSYSNGSSRFSLVVMGFSEYATQAEYMSLWHFVATGGTLILLGGQNFVAKVSYNPATNVEQYVVGHGFAFNGKTAWKSSVSPWGINNTNWVGSVSCCFHRFVYKGAKLNPRNPIGSALIGAFGNTTFTTYHSHEESSVSNLTRSSIIGTFINQSNALVAAYTHQYKEGSVICFCVFGDDIISFDDSAQYFLVQSLFFGSRNIQYAPWSNIVNIMNAMEFPMVAVAITLSGSTLFLIVRRAQAKR